MKQNRKKDILQIVIRLTMIWLAVIVFQNFFFRIDFTEEKRFTLSDNTTQLVSHLKKDLYFEIYLAGDLPYGFQKLQKATIEMLDELNDNANVNIYYELINPNKIGNPKKRNEVYSQLIKRGLKPFSVKEKTADNSLKQKLIIPGIIVHDRKQAVPINLLKSVTGLSSEQNLNHSIESIEYELTQAIRLLQKKAPQIVAFLTGHGELNQYEVADITASLSQKYQVKRINSEQLKAESNQISALIVAQPRQSFSREEKYHIDQYIMNGGKIMWLVDEVSASMDSLQTQPSTIAFYQPLNIEDQLFTYGVRINPNLIMDIQGALIPVQTSLQNQRPKFTPAPWYYAPLLSPPNHHPITRRLNVVKANFANSIDLVGENKNIKSTKLLTSSPYTRLEKVPCKISLEIVNKKVSPQFFRAGNRDIAILLEGQFTSAFKNRAWSGIQRKTFKAESKPTKMIVISDGDIIRNRVRGVGKNLKIEALGYDRYSRKTYGNRNFILNCVDYLCDNQGWLNLRSREVKLRLLNKAEIQTYRLWWQSINLLLPLLLLISFGAINYFVRKRKYTARKIE